MNNKYLDEYNKTINMLLSVEKGRQEAFKLGKQSAVNDIIEILYNTNLLNGKIMTEIMKYCHNDEDKGE